MSTRSNLAYKTKDGYSGIYCHSDGYPTWRGKQIWEIIQGLYKETHDYKEAIDKFIKDYIKGHPGGWSSFPLSCYCHRGENESCSNMIVTSKNPDPLFMEWVYILDRDDASMTILKSKVVPPENEEMNDVFIDQTERDDGKWDYGHCISWHSKIDVVKFDGDCPRWDLMEKSKR